MDTVKIYKDVNTSNGNISFGISRMEDIYVKRNGRVDEPHRHNYYTVLIVKQAKGQHKIDFNSYDLNQQQVFFVAPGQVHQVIEEEKSFGYAMTFSNQFLVENSIPLSFIESLNLFQNYGQSPPLNRALLLAKRWLVCWGKQMCPIERWLFSFFILQQKYFFVSVILLFSMSLSFRLVANVPTLGVSCEFRN